MKKILLLTALAGVLFTACGKKVETPVTTDEPQETASLVEANAEASMSIEGMVCAAGCAATIERKLNETEGVAKATVDFETGMATIAYNTEYTDEATLSALIEEMNDGQYKVAAHKEMTEEEIAACKKKCAEAGKECMHHSTTTAEGHKCGPDCKKASCKHHTEEAAVEADEETTEA